MLLAFGYSCKNSSISGRLMTSFMAAAANLRAAVLHLGYNTSPVLALCRGRWKSYLFSIFISKKQQAKFTGCICCAKGTKSPCNETGKGQMDSSEVGVHAAEELTA